MIYFIIGFILTLVFVFFWMRSADYLADNMGEHAVIPVGLFIAFMTFILWPLALVAACVGGVAVLGYNSRKK